MKRNKLKLFGIAVLIAAMSFAVMGCTFGSCNCEDYTPWSNALDNCNFNMSCTGQVGEA